MVKTWNIFLILLSLCLSVMFSCRPECLFGYKKFKNLECEEGFELLSEIRQIPSTTAGLCYPPSTSLNGIFKAKDSLQLDTLFCGFGYYKDFGVDFSEEFLLMTEYKVDFTEEAIDTVLICLDHGLNSGNVSIYYQTNGCYDPGHSPPMPVVIAIPVQYIGYKFKASLFNYRKI